MKKEEIIFKMQKHPLFNGVDANELSTAISSDDTVIKNFKTGEDIFSPQNREKKLGFILLGAANVYSSDGNRSVMLRSLSVGDTFGISNLFDDESDFVSIITAKKAASVIFLSPLTVERLLDSCAQFRKNYIKFLSQRICFLNQKISCFTAGSPERRLALFLCSQSDSDSFALSINSNSLSEMLNVGRASLYRAFDKLVSDGLITKSGKTITVNDRTILLSHYTN